MDLVVDSLPCGVHPVAGGVLIVPHVLPIFVPNDALRLSVAEWLKIDPRETSN